jgi:hypothetical protein
MFELSMWRTNPLVCLGAVWFSRYVTCAFLVLLFLVCRRCLVIMLRCYILISYIL